MMQPVEYQDAHEDAAAGRLYNFSAGPGTLPTEVMLEVKEELPVYQDVGASIMEISHRSPAYDAVEEGARERLRRLLPGLADGWHILFLQGGASMQFHQVPLNFLHGEASADYLITGAWSQKAVKEAKLLGTAREAASSADENFSYIPDADGWDLDPGAAYLHYTSNNTIFGTQFQHEPDADAPLVCDASSDFLSRPIDLDRYGLIYAGAQKNIGPAGVTVVLVHDDFLQRRRQPLPTMLDYGTHAAKRFNTPPVFAIYIVEKVLKWLEGQGGVEGIQAVNTRKAGRLYDRIDRTDFYRGTARADSRSAMNVTFRLPSEALEQRFIAEAKQEGLLALKGHRSVGGIRASIYNACPPEAVEALVGFMDAFEDAHG
ncbi:MAG: 3-phosphoserine/phosphohydroxythreonine transaminase [Rhodothermales bacterium]|nr:3-phosphoserine/phosphohydroxythreonine transaminase [Rhodothermales bacterium]